jgi:hypothetical protein
MFFAIVLAAVDVMPRNALRYRSELIQEAHFAFGLAAPIAMFAGQIHQESAWDPTAHSRFASGLAQFTPSTADWVSGAYKLPGAVQPGDPAWAIRAMLRYDQGLYGAAKPASSPCDQWAFALSDYNGGSGRRIARQRLSAAPGDWAKTRLINPGISDANQIENEDYPMRILYRWQPLYRSWGGIAVCITQQPWKGIPYEYPIASAAN